MIDEIEHLLRGHRRCDEAASLRVIIETLEPVGEPLWHAAPGFFGESGGLFEILHRHDARNDRNIDVPRPQPVEIAQIDPILEKELCDRAARPGIDFGAQEIDIGVRARGFRGVAQDRADTEISKSATRLMPATSAAEFW